MLSQMQVLILQSPKNKIIITEWYEILANKISLKYYQLTIEKTKKQFEWFFYQFIWAKKKNNQSTCMIRWGIRNAAMLRINPIKSNRIAKKQRAIAIIDTGNDCII